MVGERCRRMKTPDGIWGANDVLGRKICRGWEMQRAGFDGERCTSRARRRRRADAASACCRGGGRTTGADGGRSGRWRRDGRGSGGVRTTCLIGGPFRLRRERDHPAHRSHTATADLCPACTSQHGFSARETPRACATSPALFLFPSPCGQPAAQARLRPRI